MSANAEAENRGTPFINVTPLIDVLLVLLIIFMVAAPLKTSRFLARLPSEPDRSQNVDPYILTLVVTIEADHSLRLNSLGDLGTVDDSSKLSATLVKLFEERTKNHAYRYELLTRPDLPDEARIERTVFIKAPRSISYGEVAKVIDSIKGAGAAPIGLQLDDLN